MRIGQIAKQTGFSRDTIRWYEKIGLIKLDKQARQSNNYRIYDQESLDRLLEIKRLKAFGFSLGEIKELILMEEENLMECENVSTILINRLQWIEKRILELESLRQKLIQVKMSCTGDCKETFSELSS